MSKPNLVARLEVRFFKTDGGTEPVRDWLQGLSATDRKTIGEDIKTVQFGWPLGMPLVRKMDKGLWEVRVHLGRSYWQSVVHCIEWQDRFVTRLYQKISSNTEARSEVGKR